METIDIFGVTVKLGTPRVEDVAKSAILQKYVVPEQLLLFILLTLW